jgi:hypothetical protein
MDRYRQLFSGLDRAEAKKGYSALVTAGFVEAVERRFGISYQGADIVGFVAGVRARSDQVAAELDPDVPERVIRVVLEDAPVDDLSRNAVTGAQLLLLIGLIADRAARQPGARPVPGRRQEARRPADGLNPDRSAPPWQ